VREIFAAYEPFVGSGGYIIFDAFMNSMSAAGVREAVWWMIDHGIIHHHKYEVIGTILNIAGAGCWAGGDCVFHVNVFYLLVVSTRTRTVMTRK
jgi:hypothetical protein